MHSVKTFVSFEAQTLLRSHSHGHDICEAFAFEIPNRRESVVTCEIQIWITDHRSGVSQKLGSGLLVEVALFLEF